MTTSPTFINIPPGVVLNVSSSSAKGRYVGSDHIRFRRGKAEKIGGYTKKVSTAVNGLIRGLFSWVTSGGRPLDAGGTNVKLYSISDVLQDITPLRSSGTLANNPFTTAAGSFTITVTHTTHGLDVGAHVHYSGALAFNGVTIDGEYTVVTVPTANTYTITHSVAASGAGAGGGAAVAFSYEINPGLADTVAGTGYGTGPYGAETYGTERTVATGSALELRYWSFDRYGSFLAACPSGGTIYTWDEPGSAARAVALSGAPNARAMFITAEREIMALGATGGTTISPGAMTLAWPDVDVPTDWVPVAGNSANERILQGGSKLMGGCRYNQVNLIWSDECLFIAQFLGAFDGEVYDTRVIATGCGLIGPGAFKVTPFGVVWLSPSGPYLYAGGGVVPLPRFDDVRDYIFGAAGRVGHINRDQVAKSLVGFNPKHNEFLFFYCHDAETEPGHYFKCNQDFDYDVGTFTRTAISHHAGPDGSVIMAGTNSIIYEHESGLDADGAALEAHLDHSQIALGSGKTDMDVEGYIPDFERQTGALTLTLETRDRTMDAAALEAASFTIAAGDSLVDVRMGGRWLSGRLTSNVIGGDFRLGLPLLELGPGGESR